MANNCFTDIVISGDRSEISLLDSEMNKAFEEACTKYDDPENKTWLGYLLYHIGYESAADEIKSQKISFRGHVEYKELDPSGEILSISTDTAWEPMLRIFSMYMERYAPGATMTYTAEECTGCAYWTNDPDKMRYVVNVYENDDEEIPDFLKEHVNSTLYLYEKDYRDFLMKGIENMSTEELTDIFEKKYESVSLNRFYYAKPEEFN